MAYDKTNDLNDIQADVLTTDTTDNTKISKLKQLKTESKVPTKAINATYEQLGNAQASAADAVERTVALEETMTTVRADIDQVAQRVTRMETNGTGSAGGVSFTATNDWMRTQVKDVRSWQSMSTPVKTATAVNDLPGYDFSDDVRKFLPSTINNVTFTNTDDEESVKIYWNIDDLSAGDHEYTADYGLGYYSSSKAPTYGLHVYKNFTGHDGFVDGTCTFSENGYELQIPLNEDVQTYLPTAVTNATFTNAQTEANVDVTWPVINTEFEHSMQVNAQLPAGYVASNNNYPTIMVNIFKPVTAKHHIVGMVLAQEGGGAGTWVRVDKDFNTVDFDPEHGTWANMQTITSDKGTFVEIPITWIKTEILQDGPYAGKTCWWTADGQEDGFHVHPAFINSDGEAYTIQIASYMTSMENDVSVSKDLGYIKDPYYKINVNTGLYIDDNYRRYTIYDQHLLARLILTELGTPDILPYILNGNRYAYHDIYDIIGLYHDTTGSYIQLYGIKYNYSNDSILLLKNNGTDEFVDTGVSLPDGSGYIINCSLAAGQDFDLGDLFIGSKFATYSKYKDKYYSLGSFTDTQEHGYSVNEGYTNKIYLYIFFQHNAESFPRIGLFNLTADNITKTYWRMVHINKNN